MAIGTLGTSIIFEVSGQKVFTFDGMTRKVEGRWTDHEVMGAKPKPEFLSAGKQAIELPIKLSASLGVKPREILDTIADMVENGTAEYLIINNKPVGKNPFCLKASSETWDKLYNHGELAKATLSITLEEYT